MKDEIKLNDVPSSMLNENNNPPKEDTHQISSDSPIVQQLKSKPRFTVASEKVCYQTPPNTVPNGVFPPNTVKKNSDISQTAGTPPNYGRVNTLRNKNTAGYPTYSNTTSSFDKTNTYLNRKASNQQQSGKYPPVSNASPYNRGYPQNANGYQPKTTTPSYGRVNTLKNPNQTYYPGYPQPDFYQPPGMGYNGYQGYPVNQGMSYNPVYMGYPGYYQGGYRAPYPSQTIPQPVPQQPMPYGMYDQYTPKDKESLALSNACSKAGSLTISIFAVMFVVAIIIEFIAMYCGMMRDIPDLAKDPYAGFTPMGFYMFEGLVSLVSIVLPSLFFIKGTRKKIHQVLPFKKISGKSLFAMVAVGLSFCMIAQVMASLLGISFGLFGIDVNKGTDMAVAKGIYDLCMGVICIAVIPALGEEFAYRGLVVSILKDHDELLAVFGSAFLFGMLHGNLGQIPFAFIVGLVLGYVRIKSDSMLPSILIHFGNNCFAYVLMYLSGIYSVRLVEIVSLVFVLLFVIGGIWGVSYLAKNEKEFFELTPSKSYLTYSEKLKTFFGTGTVIASMIILVISSVLVLTLL